MIRLDKHQQPEFYFPASCHGDIMFSLSTAELLLIAKEAKSIEDFRLKLISEARADWAESLKRKAATV